MSSEMWSIYENVKQDFETFNFKHVEAFNSSNSLFEQFAPKNWGQKYFKKQKTHPFESVV